MDITTPTDQCMSVKSKNDLLTQCPHKKKFGDFCGIHHNKQTIRIDQLLTNQSSSSSSSSNLRKHLPLRPPRAIPKRADYKDHMDRRDNKDQKSANKVSANELETKQSTQGEANSFKKIRVPINPIRPIKIKDILGNEIILYHRRDLSVLRKILDNGEVEKAIDWNRLFYTCYYYKIDLRGEPLNFLLDLMDFLENWIIDEINTPSENKSDCKPRYSGPGILRFRGASFEDSSIEKGFANDTDFHEMTPLKDIPPIFLFSFLEGSQKLRYGCDIRSLHEFFNKTEQRKNPYTNLPLEIDAINAYEMRLFLLERNHVSLKLEKDEISQEKKHELDVLDIFQVMYNFGYPVDHQWYLKLDHAKKKRLYYCIEDLWSYRLDLSKEQKQEVVPHKIFTRKERDTVMSMKPKELDFLLMTRMKELVTLGKSKDDRINGSMYVLMGLIQVSDAAFEALPQLRAALSTESMDTT